MKDRLEAIESANPSEALECSLKLYKMVESAGNGNGFNLNEAWKYHNTIKQALLKAQEQEEVLKIIFKKTVGIFQLSCCKNVYEYNDLKFNDNEKLTPEEFDVLKKYRKGSEKNER